MKKHPRTNKISSRRPDRPRSHKADSKRGGKVPAAKNLKANLYGLHAVTEAWQNPCRLIHNLYITEQALQNFALDSAPAKRPAPIIVTKEQLDKAFPFGAVHQGLALNAAPLEEVNVQDLIIRAGHKDKNVILMLDQVTDPHNVGAIMRSASAFGADGIVMQRKHAPELTGVLAKTACGAVEHMAVAYETNLSRAIEDLQEGGFFVYGLDERGEHNIAGIKGADKIVLVLGAEGSGLRRLVAEHCDALVKLPTRPPIASLNVSNAAAVALYALLG